MDKSLPGVLQFLDEPVGRGAPSHQPHLKALLWGMRDQEYLGVLMGRGTIWVTKD